MTLKIFSRFCLGMSLFGIVPVFTDPGGKHNVTMVMFALVMIIMGSGFGQVSRALSKLGAADVE